MESMNESRSIRVIIADDQELVRAGFAMSLVRSRIWRWSAGARRAPKPWALAESLHPTWC